MADDRPESEEAPVTPPEGRDDETPADDPPSDDAAASDGPGVAADAEPGVPVAASMPDLEAGNGTASETIGIGMLGDVDLRVTVELGRTRMYVEDVLRLSPDSVIELDKAAGDPVDIFVNDRHVARGEVLVLDENFCIRVSEIIERPHDREGDT